MSLKHSLCALVLLFSVACPYGSVATNSDPIDSLTIDGPFEVETGQLVRLTAKTTDQETALWLVLSPDNLDYEVVDQGRRVIFASGCNAGEQVVVLLLAQQVTDGRIVTRQIRRTIQIVDDPTQGPTPAPPNRDDDPALDSSPVYQVVFESWNAIRTDAAKELSESVANNFDALAAKCETGMFSENTEVWQELAKRNRESLGIETSAWNPVASAMQRQFQKLNLANPKQHASHLRAAAAAIRSAMKQNHTRNSK